MRLIFIWKYDESQINYLCVSFIMPAVLYLCS